MYESEGMSCRYSHSKCGDQDSTETSRDLLNAVRCQGLYLDSPRGSSQLHSSRPMIAQCHQELLHHRDLMMNYHGKQVAVILSGASGHTTSTNRANDRCCGELYVSAVNTRLLKRCDDAQVVELKTHPSL